MTIKVYGPTTSHAWRTMWIVHELGIPFERMPESLKDAKGADMLQVNPNGKAPALVDGDFKLFESMAINLYLAAKYNKGGMLPTSLQEQALCQQWSFWGVAALENQLLTILVDKFVTAPEKSDRNAVAAAQKSLSRPFAVLNDTLQARDFLLGSTFTVADLNLASICAWTKPIKYDFSLLPNISGWLDRCFLRSAYKMARRVK